MFSKIIAAILVSFSCGAFAQQEAPTATPSAEVQTKQVALKEDELLALVVGKKISYQTKHRMCRLDVDVNKTVINYCDPHSDRGNWLMKESGKVTLFCRIYFKEGEKCSTIVKDEDGSYYFGLNRLTQSKITKIEPM